MFSFGAIVSVFAANIHQLNTDITIKFKTVDVNGEVDVAYKMENSKNWEKLENVSYSSSGVKSIIIPESVTLIGKYAFYASNLTSVQFEYTTGWFKTSSETATSGTKIDVTSANTNLYYWLTWEYNYCKYYWKRT